MKKYKLIKEYPGSNELGFILEVDSNGYRKGKFVFEKPEKYPEFWEEVVEKDYEILSFIVDSSKAILTRRQNGLFASITSNATDGVHSEEDILSKDPKRVGWESGGCKYGYSVNSIKRLSDGEVFTIGDKISYKDSRDFIIGSFVIEGNTIVASEHGKTHDDTEWSTINNIKHSKKALFTTEDGVDIYEGDTYYELITPNFYNKPCIGNILPNKTRGNIIYDQEGNRKNGRIWFSTKEKAQEYVDLNQPKYSAQDLINVYIDTNRKTLSLNTLIRELNK